MRCFCASLEQRHHDFAGIGVRYSSGSKVLTYALYYGYDESGSISHVTVAEIVVAITDSNETSEHKTACGMAAGGFAYGGR